jgi:c-di-GMP-binding flagellar brake protein YcgR
VPAQRSRTLNWRPCLAQLHERKGSLEIAVVGGPAQEVGAGRHLIWRVRLLDITDDELVVERPMALGRTIDLEPGTSLVAVLAIGQNRWMFSTANLGLIDHGPGPRKLPAMRLATPEVVERCQRRNHYRVETAALHLPHVDAWPLLDGRSVMLAERANEIQFDLSVSGGEQAPVVQPARLADDDMLPQVGPRFSASLMNIGGGGLGLRVAARESAALSRHKLFWLRFTLYPEVSTPICATAKVVHTHLESSQDVYAGLAFDFSFNPGHQRFVIDQICRYISALQRAQFRRRSA